MATKETTPELERLHDTLASLPGVVDVGSTIENLSGLTRDALARADLAHLPHGVLNRTEGGRDGEALLQLDFRLEPTPMAWRTLEFLAWFIREQARGGAAIQLSPYASPPQTGDHVQPGQSCRWQIDLFLPGGAQDLASQGATVASLDEQLKLAIETYADILEG